MTNKQKQGLLLKLILVAAILTIILNDFILNDIAEVISIGDELGIVLSNLSMAFISSYIFYYVVVVLKEKRDKLNIYISVYDWTSQLTGRAYSVYDKLVEGSDIKNFNFNRNTITLYEFVDLCQNVNPNEISDRNFLGTPGNLIKATYGQLIYNNTVSNVIRLSEKIFVYMPYLDTEHIHLINKLLNSTYFLMAKSLNERTGNTTFNAYAKEMYEFLLFVRELEKYNNTEIRKMVSNGQNLKINCNSFF